MDSKNTFGNIIKFIRKQKALMAIIIMFVVMSFASPYFLTAYNMSSLILICQLV